MIEDVPILFLSNPDAVPSYEPVCEYCLLMVNGGATSLITGVDKQLRYHTRQSIKEKLERYDQRGSLIFHYFLTLGAT